LLADPFLKIRVSKRVEQLAHGQLIGIVKVLVVEHVRELGHGTCRVEISIRTRLPRSASDPPGSDWETT